MGRGLHEFNVNASVFVPFKVGEGIEGRQCGATGALGPPLRSEAAEFVPRWRTGGSPHLNEDASGLDAAPAPEASPQLSADAAPFVPGGSGCSSTHAATKVAPESSLLVGGAGVQWQCEDEEEEEEDEEEEEEQRSDFAQASRDDSSIGVPHDPQDATASHTGSGMPNLVNMVYHLDKYGGLKQGSVNSDEQQPSRSPDVCQETAWLKVRIKRLEEQLQKERFEHREKVDSLQAQMAAMEKDNCRSNNDLAFRPDGLQHEEPERRPVSKSAAGKQPQVSRSIQQWPPLRQPPQEPWPRAARQFRTDAEEFVPSSRRALPDTGTAAAAAAPSADIVCSTADADDMTCASARRSRLPQTFETIAPGMGGIQQARPQRGRSPKGTARVALGLNPHAEAYRPRASPVAAAGHPSGAALAAKPGDHTSLRADAPVWEPPARLREEAARSSRAQSLQARGWTALRADAPSWEPPERRGEESSLRGVRAQSLQVRGQGCVERSDAGCRNGSRVTCQQGHGQTEPDDSCSEELVAQPTQLLLPVSHELAAAQSVGAAMRLEPHQRRWQLRRVSSMQPRVRSEAAAAVEGDSAEIHAMPVDRLLWSHGDILDHFKDGRSIYETVVQLMDGSLKPTDLPPLEVVWKEDRPTSLSNRRLWVLWKYQELLREHAGGSLERPVVYAPVVFPKPSERLQLKALRAWSTHNGGRSVELRRYRFAPAQQAMIVDADGCNGVAQDRGQYREA